MPDPNPSSKSADSSFDVAIVGAGVAGCYAAYRLSHATASDCKPGSPLAELLEANGGKLSIGLFDYSGRIGGRLLSPEVKGIPSYTSEFGGFRFNRRMHVVWNTAQMLGLDDEVFHFQGAEAQDQNIVYLRGKRLTQKEVAAGKNVPYELRPDEQFKSPGELGTMVANRAFAESLPDVDVSEQNPPPGYDVPLPEQPNGYSATYTRYQQAFNKGDWAEVKKASDEFQVALNTGKIDGRLLRDWTWWGLKRRFLSQEAVQLIEDAGGYNSEAHTGSTGSNNVSEDFYFPVVEGPLAPPDKTEVEWRHVKKGYSAIPGRLQEKFTEKGGRTFRSRQLVSFDRIQPGDGSEGYELLFYHRTAGSTKSAIEAQQECADDPSKCSRVQAKFVIFAMPRRAVELLIQDNPFLQTPQVQTLIDAVGPVPALRMFLAYDEPWFNQVYEQPANGRSTTDLGVRQFYYWATEKDGKSLLLATYSSGQAESYWRGLQQAPVGSQYGQTPHLQKGTGGHATAEAAAGSSQAAGSGAAAGAAASPSPRDPQEGGPRSDTATMKSEANRQLGEVLGIEDPPEPYFAHFQNWTKDPWGAGWHFYQPGYKQEEIIEMARQPIPDEDLYFVGECWSDVQGWVQGAINSTESTLQCKLGLEWPDFLQKEGTWLGPGTRWLLPGETDPCLPEDDD